MFITIKITILIFWIIVLIIIDSSYIAIRIEDIKCFTLPCKILDHWYKNKNVTKMLYVSNKYFNLLENFLCFYIHSCIKFIYADIVFISFITHLKIIFFTHHVDV